MRARLEIRDGRGDTRVYEIPQGGSLTIGRSSGNDIKVADRGVSREHCRVEHDGTYFWLIDRDSHNGTFLNGEEVRNSLLYDGDVIRIGHSEMVFSAPQEEAETAA